MPDSRWGMPPISHQIPGLRSIINSIRWFPRKFWKVPMFCNYPVKIHLDKEAVFSIDGRVFFMALPEMVEAYSAKMAGCRSAIIIREKGSLTVGDGTLIGPGVRFNIGQGAEVRVGSRTLLNENCNIYSREKVSIGDDCAISWGVKIMDTDFHVLVRDGKRLPESAPVVIEDHVWIGSDATVLKGVRIGKNSVVGAGAMVTHDVPPGTVVAGNPARFIHQEMSWHWM